MKYPSSLALVAPLIALKKEVVRVVPAYVPSHETVVKFISQSGKVNSHALKSWEKLQAEFLNSSETAISNS